MSFVFIRNAFIVAAIAWSCACNHEPELASEFGSPEALANAVIAGVAAKDRARLDAIAINEQEFREHVWPDLPAARPERNLPMSYVWADLHQKSSIALGATLARFEGKRFTLRRVEFSGETPYAHYRVHRDATFHVVDAGGVESSIRLCGSFIHKDGAWKVFSYVTES